MSKDHIEHLIKALALAESRVGFCAPNPSVGAVVVQNGEVMAFGRHWAAGNPHAEVDALSDLGDRAKGGTLYVTLEPCCHWGKTPPCTQRIIESGIEQVYYAFQDPNPVVAGKGAEALTKAGIHCEQIELPKINDFYASYAYWTQKKRPWVTAKLAMSLDGKIAGPNKKSIKITGPELGEFTHQQRRRHDAILTTINTILQDNPQLNVRLNDGVIKKPVYVLDSQLRLPLTARILKTAQQLTLFHDHSADPEHKQSLSSMGVRCVVVHSDEHGLNLNDVLKQIGKDGVHQLWVEVGARCFQSLLKERLANRLLIYVAPKILGSHALSAFDEAVQVSDQAESMQWKPFGNDMVCEILM